MSIKSFLNQGTADIYHGRNSKSARQTLPVELHKQAQRRLDRIDKSESVNELTATPGYQLKKLSGERDDQLAIRINDQYRICFYWLNGDAHAVDITDYHD